MLQKIDVSEAREKLSQIMEKAYFRGEKYMILRRGIPMVIIQGIKTAMESKEVVNEKKAYSGSLFGLWKNKKGTNVAISKTLREKAWRTRSYAG